MTNNGSARININTHSSSNSNMTAAIMEAATPPRCDAVRPSEAATPVRPNIEDGNGEGPSSHGAAPADDATEQGATRDSSDDGGHLTHGGALRGPLHYF